MCPRELVGNETAILPFPVSKKNPIGIVPLKKILLSLFLFFFFFTTKHSSIDNLRAIQFESYYGIQPVQETYINSLIFRNITGGAKV